MPLLYRLLLIFFYLTHLSIRFVVNFKAPVIMKFVYMAQKLVDQIVSSLLILVILTEQLSMIV